MDQIFDFMVRDFSKFALQLYSKTTSTQVQMDLCMKMLRKPAADKGRFDSVYDRVLAMRDTYRWSD
jgi:acyl-CoA dehydrogenase